MARKKWMMVRCRYCKRAIDGRGVKLGVPPITLPEWATCVDCRDGVRCACGELADDGHRCSVGALLEASGV